MQVIGIDAGASWIKAGLFSAGGSIERMVRLPSGASQGRRAYIASIAAVVQELGTSEAIGVAVPGSLSRDRRFIRAMTNVAGQSLDQAPVDLQRELTEQLGIARVALDNDANCAALAEWQQGDSKGMLEKSLLHITWGTGIGTAFVVQGRSQYGWEGGHMPISWRERATDACSCGSVQDIEAFCSVPHLVAQAQRWIVEQKYQTSIVTDELTDVHEGVKVLLQRAIAGDLLAEHVFVDALQWLARGIVSMSVLVYPDLVTVGGGMMADDWLLTRLRQQIDRVSTGYVVDAISPTQVQRARLGNEAGMIGAALLASQL